MLLFIFSETSFGKDKRIFPPVFYQKFDFRSLQKQTFMIKYIEESFGKRRKLCFIPLKTKF